MSNEMDGSGDKTTSVLQDILRAEQSAVASARVSEVHEEAVLSPPMVAKNDFAPMPPLSKSAPPKSQSQIDPDGDLFDLEREDETELPPPVIDSDDELDEDAHSLTGRIDSATQLSSSATTNPIATPPSTSTSRYDPETGLIPTPADKPDAPIPYLTSSLPGTSRQPAQPGFRRPSVVHDPVFSGAGYEEAETAAVEDETYGSSFVRPPSKGSFGGGGVGEGFMSLNAERGREGRVRG